MSEEGVQPRAPRPGFGKLAGTMPLRSCAPLLACLLLAASACADDDDDGSGESGHATTQASADAGSADTAATSSADADADASADASEGGGGGACGWGPTGDDEVPDGFVCGDNGPDPDADHDMVCPSTTTLEEGVRTPSARLVPRREEGVDRA